ncbi:MAG: tRNA preQ1(34) S-adenosylmethionine ribosyltransferase-isomerase QueA [Gemmatimonadota bacterium]|nr:tRNA preQ1(34) S-adenosylmethionine ribosyltransferase-isomerase QueA [Gemmatimonadota bacterium]
MNNPSPYPNTHAAGSRTSDYDFELPEELIAQHPVEPRDASRLMVVNRANGEIAHRTFADVAELIPAGDVLVVNTTRVFRARLLGQRASGGKAEILLLRRLDDAHFEAMVHPGAKITPGRVISIAAGFAVTILETTARRTRIVRLDTDEPVSDAIEKHGHMPLPPYIARADEPVDAERYQTVYAGTAGSVAAPTAGLHFTPALLARLAQRGVLRADVLLHVGAGTFRPVADEDPALHLMHEEWCELSEAAADTIASARARGHRVWAVGTTSVRTLESAADQNNVVQPIARETNIFLRPPYSYRAVDHLITNFHVPRSSLLMLVAAFAGYELIMRAYKIAVDQRYRFYSYGDAMCVL